MPEYRNIEGEIRLLEKESDFIFPIEIWAYNDKLTLNGWRFANLDAHREAWAGVPILVAYVNGGKTVGDGHNQATRRDGNGEAYQSFTDATAERIVGATSDEAEDIRVETEGENKWLVAKASLWRWYARELTDKIQRDAVQGGVMSVSIEALVTESHMEGDVEVEDSYVPLGITILGDGVAPAVPGAHVAMLSEMESEFKELKLRAASYINQDNADKPQNATIDNPKDKGVIHHMRLSKQQLRKLQEKFTDHKLLAAEQNEDGSVFVCMMTATGSTATYVMASADESIVPERIEAVNAQVHFCADGMEDVCVDASDMAECAAEEARECRSRAESAEKELKECRETIDKMVAAENARRLTAAKAKATATLEAFNANREDKVDTKCLEALSKDIEEGKFTALCDENGAWTGESAIEKEVKALCADAVMEMDKKNATRTEPMTWGSVKQASANPGTIGELFASKH